MAHSIRAIHTPYTSAASRQHDSHSQYTFPPGLGFESSVGNLRPSLSSSYDTQRQRSSSRNSNKRPLLYLPHGSYSKFHSYSKPTPSAYSFRSQDMEGRENIWRKNVQHEYRIHEQKEPSYSNDVTLEDPFADPPIHEFTHPVIIDIPPAPALQPIARPTATTHLTVLSQPIPNRNVRANLVASILLNRIHVVGRPMRRRPGSEERAYVKSGLSQGRVVVVEG